MTQKNTGPAQSEGDVNTTSRRAAWMAEHIDAETRGWLEEDARYFLHQALSTPCLNVLRGCGGSYIEDLQGRRYLDFHGNNVHQVGFGHPKVIAAVRAQLDELSFCTRRYTNIPAIRLAKKLSESAPGDLNRVLFAPGGTSALGMALKLARLVTGRFKTISLWDSFHGASLDAISVGGEALFRQGIGPLMPGTEHVPPPDPQHCPFHCGTSCNTACADYIAYVLEKEGDVAAVVAETMRSTPYVPPRAYWEKVRKVCDKHGALLILDEIPTCLGRTGKMFVVEHYGIVPDMLVIGTGLGGGVVPLAALIARDGFNEVLEDKALGHYTHEKNPVACAAGLAAIEVIEEEGLLARSAELGAYAMGRLRELQEKVPLVADVRGLGLFLGVELRRSDGSRATEAAEAVMYEALQRGLSFKTTMGNILTLTPPLTVSREELDGALEILEASLGEIAG